MVHILFPLTQKGYGSYPIPSDTEWLWFISYSLRHRMAVVQILFPLPQNSSWFKSCSLRHITPCFTVSIKWDR
uniref:Uncharacterized protein n=1 Tax=Anguilla anguilla TaxID=7936 RepID=A0A0E9S256_ANGAN